MPTPRLVLFAVLAFVLLGVGVVTARLQDFKLTSLGSQDTDVVASPTPSESAPPTAQVLIGAGDIASCEGDGDEKTAEVVAGIAGTVFTLGDNVYPSGTPERFSSCYNPSWGRFKERTRPVAGNHDYQAKGASGYYSYFGESAGLPTKGYYSYMLSNWKVVVINSNCGEVGGCGETSQQYRWLESELVGQECVVAMMHHPRFNSGKTHGSTKALSDMWKLLYREGVEVALAGHEHLYERFAPLNGEGEVDRAKGVRAFTVGTGGKDLYAFGKPLPGSEVRNSSALGVLKLTLAQESYTWDFLPVLGESFSDSGSDSCH